MPFNFFKKQSKPPKLELHSKIKNYCDYVSHCAYRKSDASLLKAFSGDTIRLIIFKDQYGDACDDRLHDQRVIFDSKCVAVEKGSGHQKMSRNQSDHRALLDLVFGNVELAFRGDCMRLHCTTDPLQLYLSTVFTPTRARSRESSLSRQNSTSSLSSVVVGADDSLCLNATSASIPMHLVAQYAMDNAIVREGGPGGSGMSTSVGTNWLSSMESIRPAGLSNSHSSGNIHQAVSATLPAGLPGRTATPSRLGEPREGRSKSISQSDSMTSLVSACGRSRRPTRLALCILLSPFPVEEQAASSKFLEDFFANAAQWELLFYGLCREVTDLLLTMRHPPVSEVWELLLRFRRGALQVVSGARLPCPSWLALVSGRASRKELARRFVGDCLRTALLLLNTKNTAFFLSTLLTSVLTHHSAWVRCVLHQQRHNGAKPLSRCRCRFGRPVSPTRQMHDLYGCLCCGLARVVVVGRDRLLVLLLLHVLSYFLRSGLVRSTPIADDEDGPPDDVLPRPSSAAAVPSDKAATTPSAPDPAKNSSLTDSGLSSQEDLAPDTTPGTKEARRSDAAVDERFCEATEKGVLMHLPLTWRRYEAPASVHISASSHSLFGAAAAAYSSVLALQGFSPPSTSTSGSTSGAAGWEEDLRRDLRHAVAWSGAPYAVAVVADVDAHSVREVRVDEEFGPEDEPLETTAGPARCILSMLETAQSFLAAETCSEWAADACLSSIEHALAQMICRARTLWQVYQSNERVTPTEVKRLGIETSDVTLYQSVAFADMCSQG